jgi:RNA polymerase sigma-70 factor, ECF subfamily
MATTVDHLAGSYSLLASRDAELTARFVNNALPYLNQLNDRARGLTRNAVDAEDLLQETILRAYAGFNAFSEETNLRAWLFRIMTNTYINGLRRAQHHPSEYLCDHIADALVTSPVQFRPAVYYRANTRLDCRDIVGTLARCEATVISRLRRGRQRLRTLVRTIDGRA